MYTIFLKAKLISMQDWMKENGNLSDDELMNKTGLYHEMYISQAQLYDSSNTSIKEEAV